MSDTKATDQLTGLAPYILTVYTQLVTFTEPATIDDIAHAAGTARSSTFKALTALEKRGLAFRDRGAKNGPNRRPDLWRAPHTQPTAPEPEEPPTKKEAAQPTTDSATISNTAADTTEKPGTAPEPEEAPTDEPRKNCDSPTPDQADETPAHSVPLPAQRTESASPPRPAPMTATAGGTKRLAPGGLRQLVTDHLNAHPGESFTATRISRVIDRSSGAIANALVTLAKQGVAEQVTERPRTYRATPPRQAE